jgi:hypothetical protein
MENPQVAQVFEEIADLLEIQNAKPFRVRAYRTAARTIRDLSNSLADVVARNGRKLDELPGIGKDLAEKIVTIVKTGDLPMRQELPKGPTWSTHAPGANFASSSSESVQAKEDFHAQLRLRVPEVPQTFHRRAKFRSARSRKAEVSGLRQPQRAAVDLGNSRQDQQEVVIVMGFFRTPAVQNAHDDVAMVQETR